MLEMIDYAKLPHLVTDEEREEQQKKVTKIIELTNEGWLQKDIAPVVGLSASWVSRILRRVREEQAKREGDGTQASFETESVDGDVDDAPGDLVQEGKDEDADSEAMGAGDI